MPFVFIIVGIIMTVSGVRGKSATLLTLLKSDLTGTNNFLYWIVSILIIGSLGYVDEFKTFSRALLGLVLVVLVLAENKQSSSGFFSTFQKDIQQLGTQKTSTTVGSTAVSSFTPSTLPKSIDPFYINDPTNPASAWYVPPVGYYMNDNNVLVKK